MSQKCIQEIMQRLTALEVKMKGILWLVGIVVATIVPYYLYKILSLIATKLIAGE